MSNRESEGEEGRSLRIGQRRFGDREGLYLAATVETEMWAEAAGAARLLGDAGFDGVGLAGAHAGCPSLEARKAIETAGLHYVARAETARGLYGAREGKPGMLIVSATALSDPMLLTEASAAESALMVAADEREMEELGRVYVEITAQRKNVGVIWRPRGGEDRQINLRMISALRDEFPLSVAGFSAPRGAELHCIGAVALGARVVEIAVRPNDGAEWRRVRELARDLRRVEQALRQPGPEEGATGSQ